VLVEEEAVRDHLGQQLDSEDAEKEPLANVE
jgi:hypothetical protein